MVQTIVLGAHYSTTSSSSVAKILQNPVQILLYSHKLHNLLISRGGGEEGGVYMYPPFVVAHSNCLISKSGSCVFIIPKLAQLLGKDGAEI